MLREMKPLPRAMRRRMRGLGVDTMAPPDDGGGAPIDPSSYVFGPPSSLKPTAPVSLPDYVGQPTPSFMPGPSYGDLSLSTPASSALPASTDIWSQFKNLFANNTPAPASPSAATKPIPQATPQQIKQFSSGPPASAKPQSAGGTFLDIFKGIVGAAPAAVNAYVAVTNPPPPAGFLRDPKTGRLVPIAAQNANVNAVPVKPNNTGTYVLIAGGVVLAGLTLFAVTRKRR